MGARETGDQEEGEPWALSLVVRVERPSPTPQASSPTPQLPSPTHTDVLAAAAQAVVALLVDPRTRADDGEWHDAVAHWRSGRIRKIARRARGARWERTAQLPHVQADVGTAQVRAFAPHPRDDAPDQLRSLQVGGLDLRDEPPSPPTPSPSGGQRSDHGIPPPVLTIRLTPGVAMTTGKAAAQVGHAAQLALEQLAPDQVQPWLAGGGHVRVITGSPVLAAGERIDVRDHGYTEVAPGTTTVSAGFEPPPLW